ncbi:hypothetical protein [Aureivirga sp. CE67]|uniref:hypothetical protein n=1 Tax=Aureivirga sp. CE67 TaxID=1788983 RepID=UPI0018CBEFEC|nr:hypothetical protein [Aureivirga sp. CE67]
MNLLRRFNGPVRFAIGILLIGIVFKVNHLSGGNLIISISFGLILLFYAIKVFKQKYRRTLDFIKLILIGFWCIQGILSINHFLYSSFFRYGFWISLLVWGVFEVFIDSENTQSRARS